MDPAQPRPGIDRVQETGSRPTIRRNLALCTTEGITALPIVFLTLPGNFIIAMMLTQIFHVRESIFGLLVSLPAWCNVLQLFVMPLLSRYWRQKTLTLTFAWAHLIVWIILGIALRYIPTDDEVAVGFIFFAIFFFSSFFQAIVGVSWTSWIQEWIPRRLRGKYFGMRNRYMQAITVVFILGVGRLLEWLAEFDQILGFQIIIFLSAILRVISIYSQQRILGSSSYQRTELSFSYRDQLALIKRSKSLVYFICFGAAFGFTANFFGPFFTVFMYDVLGLTIGAVGIFVILSSITGALTMPNWGIFLDRYGNRPIIIVCLFGMLVSSIWWVIVTPDNTWILNLMFAFSGIFSAGFILGSFNLLLKLVPHEAKTTAISLNLAVTSLAAALSPIIGGLILDWCWQQDFDKLTTYHWMAAAHHLLVLCSVVFIFMVHEPNSASVNQVAGAMRSYRQVGTLLGLGFLINYTFTRRKKQFRQKNGSPK